MKDMRRNHREQSTTGHFPFPHCIKNIGACGGGQLSKFTTDEHVPFREHVCKSNLLDPTKLA